MEKNSKGFITMLQNCRFSQLCCWIFKSSQMLHSVVGLRVFGVSKERSAFIFKMRLQGWRILVFYGFLDPKYKSTITFRNVRTYPKAQYNIRKSESCWPVNDLRFSTCPFIVANEHVEITHLIIIISNLSNDSSKASSKTIPPHSAI